MAFDSFSIAVNVILFAAALVGVGLLKAGLWPRRWGKERRCGRCEYLVENISADRCPECGSLLAGLGTVRGERRRLPALWGSGAFLLLVAVLWGGSRIYGDVKLYQLKPTRWVFDDLESKDVRAQERGWKELINRLEAGALSGSWEEKMGDVSLSVHLASPGSLRGDQSIKFLWGQYKAGRLSTDQVEGFFRQMVRSKWKIRPVVLVGQDLPYHVEAVRYLRDGWMRFGVTGDFRAIFDGGFEIMFIHDSVHGGSSRQAPGQQDVEIPYFVEYYQGQYEREKEANAKPIWRGEFVHREKVKVLAKTSDEYLRLIDAPELSEAIRKSIRIDKLGYYQNQFSFQFDMSCKSPPINVAFDVFARIDGKEYLANQAVVGKGLESDFGGYLTSDNIIVQLKPKRLDLIFRTNAELAGKTVEFFDVWKGELIFSDVPVAHRE
jgi:hypothetical protein